MKDEVVSSLRLVVESDANLAPEALEYGPVERTHRVQHLDGDLPAEFGVGCPEDAGL